MSNFAKTQLLKYGWTEGKGLGRNEDGIAEALKPKLKFDTTGIGHDTSEFHWWEFVYNKASNNITIDTKSQGVRMITKDKNAVDIKTTKSELNLGKLKKEQNLQYGSFVKTSTLENGKVTEDPDYVVDSFENNKETSQPFMLNDEDLFRACGGRTAHKGARHGLTLNGKLARLERQEQELLGKMSAQENSTDWTQVENKRKKKKRSRSERMDVEQETNQYSPEIEKQTTLIPSSEIISVEDNVPTQSRKTKRKAKRRLENLTHQLASSLALSEDPIPIEKKKSSGKLEKKTGELSTRNEKKRKRKKKHCDNVNNDEVLIDSDIEIVDEVQNDSDVEIIGAVECVNKSAMKKCTDGVILDPSVLNFKIEKKKRNKRCKKERQKIENLSTNFSTLDLTEESETNSEKQRDNEVLPKKKKKKLQKQM